MSKNQVKIRIQNSQGATETVWAKPLGNNKYILDNLPFFAYGLSWQDLVEACPDSDGVLEFKKIVEKSGHKTVRVINVEGEISNDFMELITSIGCGIEGATRKFIAIDIPEDVEVDKVIDVVANSGYEWEYADPTYEDIHKLD